MVQEREAGKKGGMIDTSLFRGLVPASTLGSNFSYNCSSLSNAVSDCLESSENTSAWQLVPPQVLLPLSMKSSSSSKLRSDEREEGGSEEGNGSKSFNFLVPEGRVHGGILMSLLGGNLKNAGNEL